MAEWSSISETFVQGQETEFLKFKGASGRCAANSASSRSQVLSTDKILIMTREAKEYPTQAPKKLQEQILSSVKNQCNSPEVDQRIDVRSLRIL